MKIILIIILMALFNGCGTVLTPKTKDINVNSKMPVEVWLDGKTLVSTGKINTFAVKNRSRRGHEYILLKDLEEPQKEYRIDLERDFNKITLLNITLLLGAVGYPVDLITGATGKLARTKYEVDDFTIEN